MKRDEYSYSGSELDVFKHARNWKRYWGAVIAPYVRGIVLEVGAGVGANTPYLMGHGVTRVVCLEPDGRFVDRLRTEASNPPRGNVPVEIRHGVVSRLGDNERFDTILYLDVLEHIEQDLEEVAMAAARLNNGGHLVVLAPAFQGLYSEFDRAIGHYRRYTASTLRALTPAGVSIRDIRYLDAVGAGLSAANRLLLHRSTPTIGDITFWDRYIIPVSRVVDRLLGRFAGRSVLCVWRKNF
jgi:2-polyprenyl-3-methyl-5-hydroxy-6-metoxy-1,4-benzoquinol methylase